MTEINGKANTDAPLMTVSALAEYLAVSKSVIYKWVEEKSIPHYRFGKTVRFDPLQVQRWLETRRIQPQIMGSANADFEREVDKLLRSTTIRGRL